jgi:transposase
MPKPCSQHLRDRVIDAAERGGMSCPAAAGRYEISESAAIRWLERYRREGSRETVGHGGPPPLHAHAASGFLEAALGQEARWRHRQVSEFGVGTLLSSSDADCP